MTTTVLPARPAAAAAAAPTGERRLLATAHLDAAARHAVLGPLPQVDLDALVALLGDAGLTGRGGGGFPTVRKLAAVAEARGRSAVVVNAMEGEPLSTKDATLLALVPDLVLDGLEVLAHALGARHRVVAAAEDLPAASIEAARAAIGRRTPASRRTPLGGRSLRLEVMPGGFVAGQESALVRALSGGPAVPGDPLVRVTERGHRGHPTLVVNAETAAHVALLVRFGAAWFRSVGLREDPGTFLATVSGSRPSLVARPGVAEHARGARLRDVLEGAGTDLTRVRAVLVGGFHGAWVPVDALEVRLTREDLAPFGAAVGAGIVHALDLDDCPVAYAADVAEFLARASARQCGPCVNGLPALARTLRTLADPGAPRAVVADVDRLRRLVDGRGACAHPDGTARFVLSTMRVFADHVDAHLEGRCDAR